MNRGRAPGTVLALGTGTGMGMGTVREREIPRFLARQHLRHHYHRNRPMSRQARPMCVSKTDVVAFV